METIVLRIEKKGRGGKVVTVLAGFTRDANALEELASRLKRSCGAGGTVKGLEVEIQGDVRDRVREILLKEGFRVKG